MAQSVSNEALWVKLSEMDKKLDNISAEQKTSVPTQEPTENKLGFTVVKEEIITEINEQTTKLGRHNDSHFEAHKQNFQVLIENSVKVLNIVSRIRKQQKEAVESPKINKENYFNLWLFKVRKSSFVIAMLGLLVLILTLFCMKQQNDYSLLLDGYYKQSIEVQKTQAEVDSLRNADNTDVRHKKK
jgi:hypothetical protein